MRFLNRDISIGKYKISLAALLWILLAMAAVLAEMSRGKESINNYLIFKYVFHHTVAQQNLYLEYPSVYFDTNHYGPAFSLLIAPFAVMPLYFGCFFWAMANAFFLLFAIKQLPVNKPYGNLILFIVLIEMMTSIHNVQFNAMLAAWIILSYTNIRKSQYVWAALLIVAGTFIKIYGIAGLGFFFFAKDKFRFITWLVIWSVILFCLPMLISSPAFIITSYQDWYHSLVHKDAVNALSDMQDISVAGMIRRIFKIQISELPVLAIAGILCILPLLRFTQFKHAAFQLAYVAMALISVVIFSSSAESATYVIAMCGVGIWYVIQPSKNKIITAVLILALLLTSLSPTDLFPAYVRNNFIKPYSLKALPCFIVWLILIYQLLTINYSTIKLRR